MKNFNTEICEQADLTKIISEHPIELAYCLALINCRNRYSITPPWVLKTYPEIERVMIASKKQTVSYRLCVLQSGIGHSQRTKNIFSVLILTEHTQVNHCKRTQLKQPLTTNRF